MNFKAAQIEVHHEKDDFCGDDLKIVNAARRSFDTKSEWIIDKDGNKSLSQKDIGLLEYLMRGVSKPDYKNLLQTLSETSDVNQIEKLIWQFRKTPEHDTPFNHNFITFDVKAPVFCRSQLVKSEYLIMSEFSRRYITDDIEIYWPLVWRLAAENVKQGSSELMIRSDTLENQLSLFNNETIESATDRAISLYESLLQRKSIAPEMARMVLPQSMMTSWTWSGTLGAFAKMCNLRLDTHAQLESRLVAQAIRDHLYDNFPVSSRLMIDYPEFATPIDWNKQ